MGTLRHLRYVKTHMAVRPLLKEGDHSDHGQGLPLLVSVSLVQHAGSCQTFVGDEKRCSTWLISFLKAQILNGLLIRVGSGWLVLSVGINHHETPPNLFIIQQNVQNKVL